MRTVGKGMVSRFVCSLGAVAFAALALPSAASADVVIGFDNSTLSSGTISYAGGAAPAVGTDITFDIVTFNDGVNPVVELDCTGCMLDFTTGANTASAAGLATWAGGGSFIVTGTITDPNNGNVVVASGTLLSGTFSGAVPALASVGAGDRVSFQGTGTDAKNADLLEYFGVANNTFIYANTEISTVGCDSNLSNGFNCTVEEADIVNTEVVPEPGTLALFGLGLLGAGSAIRRRIAALS